MYGLDTAGKVLLNVMNREKKATVVLDSIFRMKYLFRIYNSMALTMFKVEVM